MSSEPARKVSAILLVAPQDDDAAAWLDPQARAEVVEVPLAPGAAACAELPRAPVVLVSPSLLRSCAEEVEALRRRYRERWWCGFGDGLPEGARLLALSARVDAAALRDMADRVRELTSARRVAGQREQRVQELSSRLDLLTDTIRAAGALLDPDMVSRFVLTRAARVLGASRWCVYRVESGTEQLRLEAWDDPAGGDRAPVERLPLDRGLAAKAAARRDAVLWPSGHADLTPEEWVHAPPRHVLALPLVSRGRVIGVAEWADPDPEPFSSDRLESARALMDPAALALDNAELFRKLEDRTVTDDLTGLHNGRFMDGYLRREVKRAARYGHPVALLFIDLDGFKLVNDVHGHMAGSRTLVEVGEVMRQNVRDVDVVARWGGDEFGIVLPETDTEGAIAMGRRLCDRLRERSFLGALGMEVRLSGSIGIASFPEHAADAEGLLAAADAAMYEVKYHGKDGVAVAGQSLQAEA